MTNNLSLTSRIIIPVSLCSSVITASIVGYWLSEYWSIFLGIMLIIVGEVLEKQQKYRKSRVLEFFDLFAQLHGFGILAVVFLSFLKDLRLRRHQTMANFLAITLPIVVYSLIQLCLFCFQKCLYCIQKRNMTPDGNKRNKRGQVS